MAELFKSDNINFAGNINCNYWGQYEKSDSQPGGLSYISQENGNIYIPIKTMVSI